MYIPVDCKVMRRAFLLEIVRILKGILSLNAATRVKLGRFQYIKGTDRPARSNAAEMVSPKIGDCSQDVDRWWTGVWVSSMGRCLIRTDVELAFELK